MKPQIKWLIAGFVFVLFIAGSFVLYNKLATNNTPEAIVPNKDASETGDAYSGQATQNSEDETAYAPDFKVYDINGNAVNLSDFFGKPVVLNFWASWCGPCKSEMPDFEKVFNELGDDINFVMVNLTNARETVDNASGFIDKEGYTFPVYFDKDSDAAIAYGISGIPTSFFIDKDGIIQAYAPQMIDEETLRKGIEMIS